MKEEKPRQSVSWEKVKVEAETDAKENQARKGRKKDPLEEIKSGEGVAHKKNGAEKRELNNQK